MAQHQCRFCLDVYDESQFPLTSLVCVSCLDEETYPIHVIRNWLVDRGLTPELVEVRMQSLRVTRAHYEQIRAEARRALKTAAEVPKATNKAPEPQRFRIGTFNESGFFDTKEKRFYTLTVTGGLDHTACDDKLVTGSERILIGRIVEFLNSNDIELPARFQLDYGATRTLRDRTGLSLLVCRAAMIKTNNDAEAAYDLLRREHPMPRM